jgi:hypothetical protein
MRINNVVLHKPAITCRKGKTGGAARALANGRVEFVAQAVVKLKTIGDFPGVLEEELQALA